MIKLNTYMTGQKGESVDVETLSSGAIDGAFYIQMDLEKGIFNKKVNSVAIQDITYEQLKKLHQKLGELLEDNRPELKAPPKDTEIV